VLRGRHRCRLLKAGREVNRQALIREWALPGANPGLDRVHVAIDLYSLL